MKRLIPFEKYGAKMISMASLAKNGKPVDLAWTNALKKLINFLADVDWDELDYLIADLPPGTGDEILTIAQQMKPDYAVIVNRARGIYNRC